MRNPLPWIWLERSEIDDDQVRLLSGIECPDSLCLSKDASATLRGEVERFAWTQKPQIWLVGAARLLHVDRGAHHLPHIQFRSSCHIRPKPHDNANLQELIQFHQTAPKKQVRRGTMRDPGFCRRQNIDFALV